MNKWKQTTIATAAGPRKHDDHTPYSPPNSCGTPSKSNMIPKARVVEDF